MDAHEYRSRSAPGPQRGDVAGSIAGAAQIGPDERTRGANRRKASPQPFVHQGRPSSPHAETGPPVVYGLPVVDEAGLLVRGLAELEPSATGHHGEIRDHVESRPCEVSPVRTPVDAPCRPDQRNPQRTCRQVSFGNRNQLVAETCAGRPGCRDARREHRVARGLANHRPARVAPSPRALGRRRRDTDRRRGIVYNSPMRTRSPDEPSAHEVLAA